MESQIIPQKKKILFFLPGGAGGAERMTVTVAKMLPSDRYSVKLIVIGRLRQIIDFIPSEIPCDFVSVRNIYCFATYRIFRKIIEEKPDYVYCSQAVYNPRVIIASLMAKIPVVIRSSGMVSTYDKVSFWSCKLTYPRAHKIIAQQEDMKQEMASLLNIPLNKIVTLHNPLDVDVILKKSKETSPFIVSSGPNFVNVARINKAKGQDLAIAAFAEVHKENPSSQLFFVGIYNENDEYYNGLKKQVVSLGLEDSIHFVGFDNNPYRWVKHADCFVFPSRWEGLPNALIEASFLGIPCAVSRCLDIVDSIINDGINGYKCEVDDSRGLAEAMKRSLSLHNVPMTYHPSKIEDFIRFFDQL